jgi:hypothetical protein
MCGLVVGLGETSNPGPGPGPLAVMAGEASTGPLDFESESYGGRPIMMPLAWVTGPPPAGPRPGGCRLSRRPGPVAVRRRPLPLSVGCPTCRRYLHCSWAQRDGRVPLSYKVDPEAESELAASGGWAEWGACQCVSTSSHSSEAVSANSSS